MKNLTSLLAILNDWKQHLSEYQATADWMKKLAMFYKGVTEDIYVLTRYYKRGRENAIKSFIWIV